MTIVHALHIADQVANGEQIDSKTVEEACATLAKAYRAVTIGGPDHPLPGALRPR